MPAYHAIVEVAGLVKGSMLAYTRDFCSSSRDTALQGWHENSPTGTKNPVLATYPFLISQPLRFQTLNVGQSISATARRPLPLLKG